MDTPLEDMIQDILTTVKTQPSPIKLTTLCSNLSNVPSTSKRVQRYGTDCPTLTLTSGLHDCAKRLASLCLLRTQTGALESNPQLFLWLFVPPYQGKQVFSRDLVVSLNLGHTKSILHYNETRSPSRVCLQVLCSLLVQCTYYSTDERKEVITAYLCLSSGVQVPQIANYRIQKTAYYVTFGDPTEFE